ncbi:MAG: transcription/translation regulatory transformer protein RfaH [Halopseudomonas sabulinigri]
MTQNNHSVALNRTNSRLTLVALTALSVTYCLKFIAKMAVCQHSGAASQQYSSAFSKARLKDRMSQAAPGKWYLIQCKPRQEVRAEENLRNQAYTCYLPLHQVQRLRHGKVVSLNEPLFPGYLFIKLCEFTESWHPIRSTRGVLRLVTFANQAVPLSDQLLSNIRSRVQQRPSSEPIFASGDVVALTTGPLRDLDAIFSSFDGEERAIILLSLMHRQQQMSVPLKALRSTA